MKVRPLQDRVVVKRIEEESKTKGGINITESAKDKPAGGGGGGGGSVSSDARRGGGGRRRWLSPPLRRGI